MSSPSSSPSPNNDSPLPLSDLVAPDSKSAWTTESSGSAVAPTPTPLQSESSAAQNSTVAAFKSTPIKNTYSGSGRFASEIVPSASQVKKKMVENIRDHFVGPMPFNELFELLPVTKESLKIKPNFSMDYFSGFVVDEKENTMYDPFIEKIAKINAMPGFKLVNTSNYADRAIVKDMKSKPDLAAYKDTVNLDNVTIYREMELVFEFKPQQNTVDPFDSKATKVSGVVGQVSERPFEATPNGRSQCRGQITNYARIMMHRQHRTHCYVVYIGGCYARIIRFDRSGGLVSERINFKKRGDLLLDFLWYYSQTTDEARGLDTTVRVLPIDDVKAMMARKKLSAWQPASGSKRVYAMDVPEQFVPAKVPAPTMPTPTVADPVKKLHTVYVWGSLSEPNTVIGRATRGYPAWDPSRPEGEDIVFLKDSWRLCGEGMEKETDILQTLNRHGVRNVPKYLYGDDIPGHRTITQDYTEAKWNAGGVAKDVMKRVHIRFIEDVVGLPLWEFENPRQLVVAIHDAIIAHQDAYQLCGILHRDVSLGNILRRRDGKGGVLNDWDLAARYNIETHTPLKDKRQQSRSGTWQFMSIGLLRDPSKVHHCIDDAESFIWALLYCTMRYMKTSIVPIRLQPVMERIFDQVDRDVPGELNKGGAGKQSFVTDDHSSFIDFVVSDNEPLTSLIAKLFKSIILEFRIRLAGSPIHIDKLMIDHQFTREQAQETFDRETNKLGVQLYQLLESTSKEFLNKDWPINAPGWHDYLNPPKAGKGEKHPRSPAAHIEPDNPVDSAYNSSLDGSPSRQPRKKQKHSDNAPYRPSGSAP
uniref:Protein kinase domain-containing protein n=1 Tax=Psilocybe cubensis TaxID=181762 RepID=A0A8H8CGX3_PSICU